MNHVQAPIDKSEVSLAEQSINHSQPILRSFEGPGGELTTEQLSWWCHISSWACKNSSAVRKQRSRHKHKKWTSPGASVRYAAENSWIRKLYFQNTAHENAANGTMPYVWAIPPEVRASVMYVQNCDVCWPIAKFYIPNDISSLWRWTMLCKPACYFRLVDANSSELRGYFIRSDRNAVMLANVTGTNLQIVVKGCLSQLARTWETGWTLFAWPSSRCEISRKLKQHLFSTKLPRKEICRFFQSTSSRY